MRPLAIITLLIVTACGKPVPPAPPADKLVRPTPMLPPTGFAITLPPLDGPQGAQLSLDLAPGVHIVADRSELVPGGPHILSWFGSTSSHGTVVLTKDDDGLIGTVFDGNQMYRLLTINGKTFSIPVANHRWPKHEVPYKHGVVLPAQTYDGPIEIIAAYTPSAEQTCKPIKTLIRHAVDLTNAVAKNSKVSVRFHLSYAYRTDYTDGDHSMQETVEDFEGKDDSYMNEVHDLRTKHHADLAVLFIGGSKSSCVGISGETTATYETAFSVVQCTNAIEYLTMTHEIGHLLGLNDDTDIPDQSTFSYGFGYAHDSDDVNQRWRTVMSSGSGCGTDGCPLIPFWSNPGVEYEGSATGIPDVSETQRVFKLTEGPASAFEHGHPLF